MPEGNTNTLLTVLGGGALVWMFMDSRRAKREAREAQEQLALTDLGVHIETSNRPPGVPTTVPVSAPAAPPPGRRELARVAPRTFDATFAMYGHGLPVAYLRALALYESDMNPRAQMSTSSATGLLQVVNVVRRDFNTRNGTAYERRDLLDPSINVTVASDLLARIITGYDRFHPEVANLRADWSNPRFVELLTFGWNAGFSERAGVGLVVSTLVARRQRELTIDDVFQAAKAAGAAPTLSNPRKVRWAKAVAAQYMRERSRDEVEGYQTPIVAVAAPAPAEAEPVSSPSQVDGPAEVA